MARNRVIVSFSASPEENAAYRAASGGELSVWIRNTLNHALASDPFARRNEPTEIGALVEAIVPEAAAVAEPVLAAAPLPEYHETAQTPSEPPQAPVQPMVSLADVQAMIKAALASAGKPAEDETTSGYVPRDPNPPVKPGVKSLPITPDQADWGRQRGLVAGFIRGRGGYWKGNGPNPLERGCTVRADVMAEYQPQLDDLREELAAEERAFAGGPQ